MAVTNLSQKQWYVEGWRPYAWMLGRSMETNAHIVPDIGPVPACIPGSVQNALLTAGILPDWSEGVNSRQCEWVEHRHWFFETLLTPDDIPAEGPLVLEAEGLDYSGWIVVDGKQAARFEGALITHRFDLREYLTPGQEHRLGIVFEEPPREQGQIGYTSRSRHFKPRYQYSWDWCPRLVSIGVWDGLRLLSGPELWCESCQVNASLDKDLHHGSISVSLEIAGDTYGISAQLALEKGESIDVSERIALTPGENRLELPHIEVNPWWPNGAGEQMLYTLKINLETETRAEQCVIERRIGFKQIEWRPCEGAPADAEPWICAVNGIPIFLQGANWVPPTLDYHSASLEDYQRLIGLYHDMGCNVLRVWGGAILEREWFYDLCDEAGILVWQEFPLSSSGVENYPPDDPEVIGQMAHIAQSYIRRRAYHVSLLLWCGGNELTERNSEATPIGYDHPCIAALKEIVEREDPGHRFVPTSASGPQFYAHAKNYGKGIHHDVHGPWGMSGFENLDAWRAYWEHDDALFRSEVGMPGASSEALLKRFSGGLPLWPPLGEYWIHGSAWWIQWEQYRERLAGLSPEKALSAYVQATQEFQAEAYAIAAASAKRRFPRCGGFIIWMGHDLYPCPANNAVIDFLRAPKPAYFALKRVFTGA